MKKYFTAAMAILTATVFIYISACKTKKATTQTTKTTCASTPTYTADIKTIIDVNCASSCHSAKNHARGIDLSTYETTKDASANKSFMGSMNHEEAFAPMPKNHDKLDDATLQKISCWIQNGSPK